jgi:hypothetical protein
MFNIPEGRTGSLGDLRKRSSNFEPVEQTCNIHNVLTVIFVWVIVGLCTFLASFSNSNLHTGIVLLYTLYFASLAKVASWRIPDVWHSQVAKFDWSITSADYIDPRGLKRPGNPQMEKSSEKSTPTGPSFQSNFVNPFSNTPIDDFAPQFAIVHPPRPRGQALDRHQLMNRYAYEPETPASQKMSTRSTQGFGSLTISSHGTTFEDFDARQLAAMKLEGKAPEHTRIEKSRPHLSIRIPPPSRPITRISTGGGVRPKSQVDREQEFLPFQGSFSSEGGRDTTPEPSSVPNIPPLHMSFLNQGFSPIYKSPLDEPQNLALQSVLAPHRYPDIVRTPNRKSTKIVPGSIPHAYPQADPQTLTSAAPSGAVLPMHSGDLYRSRPRRVPVPRDPTLPPPKARTSTTPEMYQAQVRRSQTERQSRVHGPRSVSGSAHNRSSSNQTWPPHAKQSRHVPTGSDPTSTGPRGPWSPPGLTSYSNSEHRQKSVYDPRMPPRGWHYPSSSTSCPHSTTPSLSSSVPTSDTGYPSVPPPVVSKTSRTIAGTEDQAFGTPATSDHLPSSYESTQATWQELDEQLRLKCRMDDKRSSRGKLRKPNPRIFNDTL